MSGPTPPVEDVMRPLAEAIRKASERKLSPVIFRINRAQMPHVPRSLDAYRNIPIDRTTGVSHLQTEEGTQIEIEASNA
jgi:hypothetical protein